MATYGKSGKREMLLLCLPVLVLTGIGFVLRGKESKSGNAAPLRFKVVAVKRAPASAREALQGYNASYTIALSRQGAMPPNWKGGQMTLNNVRLGRCDQRGAWTRINEDPIVGRYKVHWSEARQAYIMYFPFALARLPAGGKITFKAIINMDSKEPIMPPPRVVATPVWFVVRKAGERILPLPSYATKSKATGKPKNLARKDGSA